MSEKLSKFQGLSVNAAKTAEKLGLEITKLAEETIPYLETVQHIPLLSQTAKSKLAEIWTSETEGVIKNIKSKFLSKGLDLEEDGLTAYSLFMQSQSDYDGTIYNKITERKKNEWVEGSADSKDSRFIIDTKISWDIYSFDANRFKPLDITYLWQGKSYSWLYEKEGAKIVHVLLNTPEYLIQAEERKLAYELFGELSSAIDNPIYVEACKELRAKHIHDHRPLKRRVYVTDVPFNFEEDTEKIKQCVKDCRYYLNNIEKQNYEQEEEIQTA